MRHAKQSLSEFLQSISRETIRKRKVGKVTCIRQTKERICQERVIVDVIPAADAVVSERTMVTHHLDASVTPAAVMSSSISNPSTLDTNLVAFHETSVSSVGVLVLRIPRANEDGHVVIENSISHHVTCEKGVPPP